MSEPVIQVSDVTVGWDKHNLLEHVSFDVQRGEVFVVLGASGSGKTSLMRYLIGLDRPRAGRVSVLGNAPAEPASEADSEPPPFGVMFQFGALLGSLTVGENVALPLGAWTHLPDEVIRILARSKLRLVGLEDAQAKLPSELSGGMRKRAAIARALALEPQLLFLDEPSAGLDPIAAAELDALIVTLNASLGVTVLLVTHDLDSLFAVGKRCILLDPEVKGIIAEGEPRELREHPPDPRVRAFFERYVARRGGP
jgi:phospholipid/cholesterol/gamma-HCH transport system ATP-binding protein